jgi:hypothetical protein
MVYLLLAAEVVEVAAEVVEAVGCSPEEALGVGVEM